MASAGVECLTCGAVGERHFSANFFGELVCELCGTQSLQQSRNETRDLEDLAGDALRAASQLKRSAVRSRRRRRRVDGAQGPRSRKAESAQIALADCLLASQRVLARLAQELIDRLPGFPSEFAAVVRDLWLLLLETWEARSDRPLLRSFTEYAFLRQPDEDRAVTQDLLAQWDASRLQTDEEQEEDREQTEEPTQERTKTLKEARHERARTISKLRLPDLVAILVLAARMLNMPLLPCDFARWIQTGVLPYGNLLEMSCDQELRARLQSVTYFFEPSISNNKISAATLAFRAHRLQRHMELHLPPVNASMIVYGLVENLGLPAIVFRNFQWVTGLMNVKGPIPEKPLLAMVSNLPRMQHAYDLERILDSGPGIAAYMIVAIKMCPNWFEWVFQRLPKNEADEPPTSQRRERLLPADLAPGAGKVPSLPRRQLVALIELCEQTFVSPTQPNYPPRYAAHVETLRALGKDEVVQPSSGRRRSSQGTSNFEANRLVAYPAIYKKGFIAESDGEIEERVQRLEKASATADGIGDESESEQSNTKGKRQRSMSDDGVDPQEDLREQAGDYFYPFYYRPTMWRGEEYHAPYEKMVEVLCEHFDIPMATVMSTVYAIDMRFYRLCHEITRTDQVFNKKRTRKAE